MKRILCERGRYKVNKVRRAAGMKTEVEYSKRCYIAAVRKRVKTVSLRRGIDKTKTFWLYPV